ncbi:MAG: MFS transporter [bacterium]|nr:MFS transporter [bacterium]
MPKNINLHLILGSLWLLMFASSSQFFIIAPILPQLGEQLNIAENIQGTLISGYAFSLAISALFIGPVSDKIGRRRILILGSATMAVALGLHPFAYDYTSILTLRLIAGIAGGILTGSCVSYIRDVFPYNKRGWANGIVATGSAAGQILGIPIGKILASQQGFDTPFLFFSAVMAIAFFMIMQFVPHTSLEAKYQRLTWSSFSLTGYKDVLKSRHFGASAVGYVLMFFSISMFMVYFPTWLEVDLSFSSEFVALILSVGGIATLIGSPLAGRLTDLVGRKSVNIVNNLGLAVSILALATLDHSGITLVILSFFTMLFLSGRLVSFQALISDITSDSSRGRFMCLSISIGQIGMGLGSFFSGFVFDNFSFLGNVVISAIACIAMIATVLVFDTATQVNEPVAEMTPAEIS